MITPTDSLLLAILKTLGSDTATLGAATLGLIQGAFTPGRNLKTSNFTEANFDGYARRSLGTTTITFTSADGNDYLQWVQEVFTPTGSDTPNSINGYFIMTPADTVTVGFSEPITPAVPLSGPHSNLTVTPRYGNSPLLGYGSGVVSD